VRSGFGQFREGPQDLDLRGRKTVDILFEEQLPFASKELPGDLGQLLGVELFDLLEVHLPCKELKTVWNPTGHSEEMFPGIFGELYARKVVLEKGRVL